MESVPVAVLEGSSSSRSRFREALLSVGPNVAPTVAVLVDDDDSSADVDWFVSRPASTATANRSRALFRRLSPSNCPRASCSNPRAKHSGFKPPP